MTVGRLRASVGLGSRVLATGAVLLSGCAAGTTTAPAPVPAPAAPARAVPAPAPATPPSTPTSVSNVVAAPTPAPADVAASATAVFGASPDVPTPSEGDGPAWDIDVTSFAAHDRVAHYVSMFSGSAKGRIESRLSRGTQYEAMIRQKLRDGGLPEDMYYLALVESGYDPDAYSRAAAVGMWQFMTTTARGIGLRVDGWVDERRDPVRATDGAVKFLNWLNAQFGSLYLAAAAYNGGPGRVSRGLRKYEDDLDGISGDSLFFALAEQDYLRAETKNYVPQLIAAAMVGKAPAQYGLTVDTLPPFVFDTVRVPALTPLSAVAQAAQAAPAAIARLNPHLLRGVTPPGAPSIVRVPIGGQDGFEERFAALDSAALMVSRVLVTKKGETAASFAARAGVPVRTLGWFGTAPRRSGKTRLVSGQKVRVPTEAVLALARAVPDPGIEKYGPAPAGRRVHLVRRGESLGAIAKRYGTSVAAIKRLNGLKRATVIPGQRLIVRGGAAKRSGVKSKSASTTKGTKGTKKGSAAVSKAASKKKGAAATSKTSAAGKRSAAAKKSAAKKGSAAKKTSTKKAPAAKRTPSST
ncbi:MAG: transglycosylase SLT domain-containing protein [Gemmatimonadaceae bacterium]|nr:transglycosylase SLT domain-containing protein [Gemmatimonadaceae bacterium]